MSEHSSGDLNERSALNDWLWQSRCVPATTNQCTGEASPGEDKTLAIGHSHDSNQSNASVTLKHDDASPEQNDEMSAPRLLMSVFLHTPKNTDSGLRVSTADVDQ